MPLQTRTKTGRRDGVAGPLLLHGAAGWWAHPHAPVPPMTQRTCCLHPCANLLARRVYQLPGSINVGCSPPQFPTAQYIACHRSKCVRSSPAAAHMACAGPAPDAPPL